MNIIEAVKSGKPFKRKNSKYWLTTASCSSPGDWADIITEDWELQEPSITITKNDFFTAYHAVIMQSQNLMPIDHIIGGLVTKLFEDKV